MARKVPQFQIDQRIEEVFVMLTNGATNSEIVRFSAETWHLNERQTENYIARARDRFREMAAFDRPEQVGLAISRFSDLYRRALATGDHRGASSIQERLCRLLGLEPTKDGPSLDIEGTIRRVYERAREARARKTDIKDGGDD